MIPILLSPIDIIIIIFIGNPPTREKYITLWPLLGYNYEIACVESQPRKRVGK